MIFLNYPKDRLKKKKEKFLQNQCFKLLVEKYFLINELSCQRKTTRMMKVMKMG
jgi:hypothetical protein